MTLAPARLAVAPLVSGAPIPRRALLYALSAAVGGWSGGPCPETTGRELEDMGGLRGDPS